MAGAAVGIALRVWAITGQLGTLDADEAVAGLMGLHFLRGEHAVFFWGQSHGGSLEPIIAAAVFSVLGSAALQLKLVPLLLDVIATVLVWRIGLRVLGRRPAAAAAVLFWIWPATYVWWSTKERGFYWAGLVLGLLLLLATLRLVAKPDQWRDWVLFGLAAGLGFWTTPQIAYYLIPATAWLLIKVPPRSLWRGSVAVLAAAAGASPWIVYNLHHNFESLVVPAQLVHGTYLDHMVTFFTRALPIAVSVMVPNTYDWVVPVLGPLLYIGVLLLIGLAFRRPGRLGLLLLFVAAYPFIHAMSPLSQYVDEARYLVYLAPVVALLLVAVARRGLPMIALLAGGLVLSGAVLFAMQVAPTKSPDTDLPASMAPLVQALESRGVHHALANYFITYRLNFESREQVIAASTDTIRYAPYQDEVFASSDSPAWIFVAGSPSDTAFNRRLSQTGVPVERVETGGFTVYLPAHRTLPQNLPPG